MPKRTRSQAVEPEPEPVHAADPDDRGEAMYGDDEDENFADNDDGLADHYNNPNRVDLSEFEAPEVGPGYGAPPGLGSDTFTQAMGGPLGTGGAQPIIGRPTSPRLWASAHLFPAVTQLRVWKRVNGNPILVGIIDAQASEEDFIREFITEMPIPGETATFIVRPVDRDGREVREEVTLPPISGNHSVLRKIRTQTAGAVGGGYGHAPAVDLSPVIKLEERLLGIMDTRMQQVEASAQAERERARLAQEEYARRSVDLGERAAMATEAITERMMNTEAARAERAIEAERVRAERMQLLEKERNDTQTTALTTVFTQMQSIQEQAAARERDAYDRRMREDADRRDRERREDETRRERERQDYDRKIQQERDEWQRKLAADKQESEERRERERRESEERIRTGEAERQRQHDLRMREMELQATRDREHAERMMTINTTRDKGESLEGMVERGAKLLGMFGMKPSDIVEKLVKGDDDDEESALPAGLADVLGKALVQGIQTAGEVIKANIARQQQPAGMPPAGYLPNYLPQQAPPGAQQQPVPVQAQPVQAAPGAEHTDPAPQAAEPAPPKPGSELPLTTQKAARNAIRDLVRALRGAPQTDAWEGIIANAVQNEFAIYHYCKATTIKYALREGGADDELVEKVLNHQAVQMIPADVPRG